MERRGKGRRRGVPEVGHESGKRHGCRSKMGKEERGQVRPQEACPDRHRWYSEKYNHHPCQSKRHKGIATPHCQGRTSERDSRPSGQGVCVNGEQGLPQAAQPHRWHHAQGRKESPPDRIRQGIQQTHKSHKKHDRENLCKHQTLVSRRSVPISRTGKSAHTECTRRNGVQPLQDAGTNYVPRAEITSKSEEKDTPHVLLRQKTPPKIAQKSQETLFLGEIIQERASFFLPIFQRSQ